MRIPAYCPCFFLALVVCATKCLAQIPLPEDINIVPPSVSLSKDVAAFSGKWFGVWSGKLQSLLIVEEIDGERAKVVYAWGDAPDWKINKGFQRYVATVAPGDKKEIQFRSAAALFTVRMNDDLSSITITRVRTTPWQAVNIETFKRVVR